MVIIVDRKKKRHYLMMDENVDDPFGLEHSKQSKRNTIEIPKDSKNPAHQVMVSMGVKALLGRQAYCLNDRKEMVSGFIVDVIPPYYLHLKNKGVFKIDDVISIGG